MSVQKSTFNEYLAIVSSTFGIVGSVIGMLKPPENLTAIVFGVTLLASLTFAYLTFRKKYFTDHVGDTKVVSYQISKATRAHLLEIAEMQKKYYKRDAVPLEKYQEWYDANPNGFYVVHWKKLNDDKILVGHITFISIKKSLLDLYKKGRVLETDISGEDLYKPTDTTEIDNIYIESIILDKSHRSGAKLELYRLLPTMVERYAGTAQIDQVYAMAATEAGSKLIDRFGFENIQPIDGNKRKDGHQMYQCKYDKFLLVLRENQNRYALRIYDDNPSA